MNFVYYLLSFKSSHCRRTGKSKFGSIFCDPSGIKHHRTTIHRLKTKAKVVYHVIHTIQCWIMLCKYVYNFVGICNQMESCLTEWVKIWRNQFSKPECSQFDFHFLFHRFEFFKWNTQNRNESIDQICIRFVHYVYVCVCRCETNARKIWLNVIEQAYNEHRQHFILHDLWTTNVKVTHLVFDTKIDYYVVTAIVSSIYHISVSMLANSIDIDIHIYPKTSISFIEMKIKFSILTRTQLPIYRNSMEMVSGFSVKKSIDESVVHKI